MFSAAKKRS